MGETREGHRRYNGHLPARSSSGLGCSPLKAEISGSNPLRATAARAHQVPLPCGCVLIPFARAASEGSTASATPTSPTSMSSQTARGSSLFDPAGEDVRPSPQQIGLATLQMCPRGSSERPASERSKSKMWSSGAASQRRRRESRSRPRHEHASHEPRAIGRRVARAATFCLRYLPREIHRPLEHSS